MGMDESRRMDLDELPVDPFELVGQGFRVESLTADHSVGWEAPPCFCGPVHTHVRSR